MKNLPERLQERSRHIPSNEYDIILLGKRAYTAQERQPHERRLSQIVVQDLISFRARHNHRIRTDPAIAADLGLDPLPVPVCACGAPGLTKTHVSALSSRCRPLRRGT